MPKHYDPAKCQTVSEMLSRIGNKWSVLVIMILGDGPARFSDLKRAVVGVSQRMLTLTLRALERDGLVKRSVYPTVPPRVEYELTELGQSLREPIQPWAAGCSPIRQDSRGPCRVRQATRRRAPRSEAGQAGLRPGKAAGRP
jgi:DNA-binding HxlR family transcriptional regulator